MPRILVADDSPVERTLYAGLITRHIPFAEAVQAVDGSEVLKLVEQSDFDLILTDFQMPKVDGLEVLTKVSQMRPGLPVVVMTGCGCESTAIQALQAGAASYLTKRDITQRLIHTIENVLQAADVRHSRRRILSSLVTQTSHFEIENDVSLVAPLISYLQEQLQATQACNDTNITRIGVALHEALTNAIYHGNLELDSSLRQEDEAIFYELADQRRFDEYYAGRRVHFSVAFNRNSVTYVIRDEGPGFDINQVKDPTADENLIAVGGRGLLLIRSFMDQVLHNAAGNQITMIKNLFRTPAKAVASASIQPVGV